MTSKKVFAILAIGVVVVLVAVVLWRLPGREPSPKSLLKTALNAADSPQRVHAAVELTQMLADRERTLPYVRQLATETKDPEVLAIGVRGLAWALDGDSVPIYLTAMEHEDSKVREAGVLAMKTIGGGTLGDGIFGPIGKKLTFAPGDPPESRRAVVKELRALYELRLADEAEYKAMEAAFRSGK